MFRFDGLALYGWRGLCSYAQMLLSRSMYTFDMLCSSFVHYLHLVVVVCTWILFVQDYHVAVCGRSIFVTKGRAHLRSAPVQAFLGSVPSARTARKHWKEMVNSATVMYKNDRLIIFTCCHTGGSAFDSLIFSFLFKKSPLERARAEQLLAESSVGVDYIMDIIVHYFCTGASLRRSGCLA